MQHPDINLIFVHALNAARAYLEERGAIPVFAYVLLATEEDQLRRVVPNPVAGQGMQEVVEQLRAFLRQAARAEGYRAVAIITAEQPEENDNENSTAMLQVAVDHSGADPIIWHVPVRRVRERYEFGTTDGDGIVTEGKRFIFTE